MIGIMKELFLYMYYRTARFYKYFGQWDPESVGMLIYLAFISNYINAIIILLYYFFFEADIPIIYSQILIGTFAVIGMFTGTEKLYAKLDEKYKNESNRVLKGWIVFVVVTGGWIAVILSWSISKA